MQALSKATAARPPRSPSLPSAAALQLRGRSLATAGRVSVSVDSSPVCSRREHSSNVPAPTAEASLRLGCAQSSASSPDLISSPSVANASVRKQAYRDSQEGTSKPQRGCWGAPETVEIMGKHGEVHALKPTGERCNRGVVDTGKLALSSLENALASAHPILSSFVEADALSAKRLAEPSPAAAAAESKGKDDLRALHSRSVARVPALPRPTTQAVAREESTGPDRASAPQKVGSTPKVVRSRCRSSTPSKNELPHSSAESGERLTPHRGNESIACAPSISNSVPDHSVPQVNIESRERSDVGARSPPLKPTAPPSLAEAAAHLAEVAAAVAKAAAAQPVQPVGFRACGHAGALQASDQSAPSCSRDTSVDVPGSVDTVTHKPAQKQSALGHGKVLDNGKAKTSAATTSHSAVGESDGRSKRSADPVGPKSSVPAGVGTISTDPKRPGRFVFGGAKAHPSMPQSKQDKVAPQSVASKIATTRENPDRVPCGQAACHLDDLQNEHASGRRSQVKATPVSQRGMADVCASTTKPAHAGNESDDADRSQEPRDRPVGLDRVILLPAAATGWARDECDSAAFRGTSLPEEVREVLRGAVCKPPRDSSATTAPEEVRDVLAEVLYAEAGVKRDCCQTLREADLATGAGHAESDAPAKDRGASVSRAAPSSVPAESQPDALSEEVFARIARLGPAWREKLFELLNQAETVAAPGVGISKLLARDDCSGRPGECPSAALADKGRKLHLRRGSSPSSRQVSASNLARNRRA